MCVCDTSVQHVCVSVTQVCSMCVLKRDHHCFFTSSCVGLHNQRYFLVFLLYVVIGTGLHALLNASALPTLLFSTPGGGGWLAVLPPPLVVGLWMGGLLPGQAALLGGQLWLTGVTCVGAGGFLAWQCCVVLRAQTSHEFARGIVCYQVGQGRAVGDRMREVFGPYWAGNLVFPLRTLPSGDGFVWKSEKQCKGH